MSDRTVSRDSDKARELVLAEGLTYRGTDEPNEDAIRACLAAMRYAYQEAAQMSSSRITALALRRDREVMVQFSEALESRARDLGAE